LILGPDKESIDTVSKYFVWFRNTTSLSFVMIQQLNRAKDNPDRIKANMLEPMLSDWKDSGNTIQDCNVAISIFSPYNSQMNEHRGYSIARLKDRYRDIAILKNRYGPAPIHIGVAYYGAVGRFEELPKKENITEADYDRVCT
jgi:replicative DNA helicase